MRALNRPRRGRLIAEARAAGASPRLIFETKTIRLRSSQREHPSAETVSDVPPTERE